jgi:alginate O-acetyltransferase complex protein AlgI
VRVDDPVFLLQALPALLSIYFLVLSLEGWHQSPSRSSMFAAAVLLAASVLFVAARPAGWWLVGAAATGVGLGARLQAGRDRPGVTRAARAGSIVVAVGALILARAEMAGRVFAFSGAIVIVCHIVSYAADVARGESKAGRPVVALLYLVQLPLLAAGPILRYGEFSRQVPRMAQAVGLGSFTYGMRRLLVGLFKVAVLARILSMPVDAVFALPRWRLGTDVAWLAAAAFSLQIYYQFSGYADMAIGLGRMFGLRYPDNFRRPYLADSVREFWRRWNVTAVTWLRDYLSLPMAGRDRPTPRLLPAIVLGFVLLGLWHGAGRTTLLWALYSAAWLALEALGFGARLERWPAVFRHVYLLLVMVVGWVILRADTVPAALLFLQTMAGLREPGAPAAIASLLTWPVVFALVTGVVGAGPLVPSISRWRVSVDAFTTAAIMMGSAVGLFIWRGGTIVRDAFAWKRPPSSR